MSNSIIKEVLQSPRAHAEYERLRAALDERNQALHRSEQRISEYQANEKNARWITRAVMAMAVIIIFIMGFGGNL